MALLRDKLRHAFAVDPPGPEEPSQEQQEAVDWFCRQVAKRHLTTPGLIALEMSRPLNYFASQAMHFIAPGVWSLVRPQTYQQYQLFAEFLERRGSVEYLARRVEHFEQEFERLEAEARQASRLSGQPQKTHPAGAEDVQE